MKFPTAKFIFLKAIVLLFILVFPGPKVGAVIFSATTLTRMKFMGRPLEIVDNVLHLDSDRDASYGRMGIPLENLANIEVIHRGEPLELMGNLRGFTAALPFFDEPAVRQILAGIRELVSSRSWRTAYEWARRLSESRRESDQIQFQAEILRARCLLEMGHLMPLADCLRKLNAHQPAIDAPLELAWVNARFHFLIGEQKEAEFWAILPGVRIPMAAGPLMKDLNQLRHEMQVQRSSGSRFSDYP